MSTPFFMETQMNYINEIYLLSQKFINDYPQTKYPELMYKQGRPYNCLLIESRDNYFICIPYRSNINHNNSFMFKSTQRSLRTKSGLDYSKLTLIKDTDYLDNQKAIIDQDEYKETIVNLHTIAEEVNDYISDYTNHIEGIKTLHPKAFARKYQFSTLPYFHDILNID